MKRYNRILALFLVSMFIMLGLLAGCSQKRPHDSINDLQLSTVESEQLNTIEGISLVNMEYDSDNSTIKFTLDNKTREDIYFGEDVILEKKYKDQWYLVPHSGEIGFTDILNNLPASKDTEIRLPINVWIPITDGDYRIIKEISWQEGFKNLYYISADFTIAK